MDTSRPGRKFQSMIVQKRENMVDGIEEVIVSLYAKGMSVADIEDQIRDVYNFEVSTSTISRIKPRIAEDIVSWQNWPLEPLYLIVWLAADRRMESSSKCVKTAKNFVQW